MEENNKRQFTVTEEILASHSQRFLNLLMDYIAQLFLFIIAFTIAVAIAESNGNKNFMTNFVKNDIAQYTFVTCIALVYYNLFEIFFARTVGKFITQTIVVDENGEKPNYERILMRTICRLIPFESLSFLTIPARGWHDSISKTYVVNKHLLDEKKKQFYALQNS
ncbi:RDD family protein [Flavobacterium paronense]|uniref:RDD family protein n=1 Tax=Flavobacterium paronense TaxID=1392775 RepID=A0ABV5GFA3_9FLAO|nr:RDD family protein [Flavobacterium paronense]MDN3676013.1 RDD family protein [Flavobacterium paronense]MDN3678641.1 RDD family protein [Flavobacterium paronense]